MTKPLVSLGSKLTPIAFELSIFAIGGCHTKNYQ